MVGPTGRACALSNNMALPIIGQEHYVLVAGTAGDRDERGWETDLFAGLGLDGEVRQAVGSHRQPRKEFGWTLTWTPTCNIGRIGGQPAVGDRLHSLPSRQRPDLTETRPRAVSTADGGALNPTTHPALRAVVLALLAVDGVLSAIAGALLLPWYIGAIPFPISALISGLVNAALVWAAGRWTRSPRLAALPLWTWLLTVAIISVGGPGGDVILEARACWPTPALLLVVLGGRTTAVGVVAAQPLRHRRAGYGNAGGSGGSGGRKPRIQ